MSESETVDVVEISGSTFKKKKKKFTLRRRYACTHARTQARAVAFHDFSRILALRVKSLTCRLHLMSGSASNVACISRAQLGLSHPSIIRAWRFALQSSRTRDGAAVVQNVGCDPETRSIRQAP